MTQVQRHRPQMAKGPTVAAGLAVAWCAVIWVGALVAPAYSTSTETVGPNGPVHANSTRTLVEVNGVWILILLVVPLAITLCAALWSRTRLAVPVLIGTTVMLWLAILATGFSVGLFYVPAGVAMFAALVMAFSQPTMRGDHPNLG